MHVSPDEQEAERFRRQWVAWGDHLRLEIIVSPYRAIIAPLAHYAEAMHTLRQDLTLTAILPELVVRYWWHRLLHTPARATGCAGPRATSPAWSSPASRSTFAPE